MSWHYQVRKRSDCTPEGDWYDIVEMYNNDGKLSWTQDAIEPGGETLELLIKDLERMLDDARKYPVFEEPS